LRALLGRLGPDARDPVDEFLTRCLMFQRSHTPSLQLFLHWLAATQAEIKREHDPGGGPAGGVVRIMTVHGAKGLQAPVVIMPDTTGMPTQSVRILWPEGERTVPLYAPRRELEEAACTQARAAADHRRDQEYRRLLYVALTRAEDRLYVCGAEGRRALPPGSWYALVREALAAEPEARPFAFAVPGAEGWSGEGLGLAEPQTAPPRDDAAAAGAGLAAAPLPPWWDQPAPPEPEPSRPLAPSRPDEAEPPVQSPLGADDGGRFRRGLMLHRLFQTLPDLEPGVRAAACTRYLARPVHGLSAEVQREIAAEALRVLEHPDFAPLFGPGSRAEVPVVGVVGERVLAGQIDRLLVTPEAVWILDYKTNRPPPQTVAEVPPVYLRQLGLYRAAVEEIYPDRAVRCLLLWTDVPALMEIPAGLLAPAGA
jgi:ATP-dependent helicase/nuclease subunit A